MDELVLKYNLLDDHSKVLLFEFMDFLLSKTKNKGADFKEYGNRIKTVSQWSEEDVAYLTDIENNFETRK